jgi:protein-disulfide isomerase
LVRSSVRLAGTAVLAVLIHPFASAIAQQQAAGAPVQDSPAPAASPAPSAPVFPKPNPADFTATTPTKEVVAAFMQANLGFDENNVWQIQAIQKTQVEGISKVTVLIGDKTGKQQPYRFAFFTTPDGKHIIVGDKIVAFGEHPFAEYRAILQQRANGPYRGSATKDLELIEFADFQCPHCKEAQANMEKLVADFPKARIVFQNYPIASIHPQAVTAAAYATCVAKEAGSTAFFQFAGTVFDGQDGLNSPDGATLTLNSAATKAGVDPAKIAACAATPETKAVVDASVQLASDVNISAVPALMVNGRQIPANAPYETLKQIILFQAKLDGVAQ